jgi:cytochrome c biogenesis protein CcmG, thiol:disulfide interchange protein DsbE
MPRRRFLTLPNLILAAVWVFLLVRLAPHLAAVVGIESGDQVTPHFTYLALDQGVVSTDSLRGRVVLVNVWATWCPPCKVEMPLLQSMYERHRAQGFVVVGLSVDTDPPDSVRAFLRKRGITYPVAQVEAGAPPPTLGPITGYPTSLLLDRTGRIRHRAMGPLAMASFEPAVRRLLAEGEPPPA